MFSLASVLLMFCLSDCTKYTPVASFSVDNAVIYTGQQVTFTDRSINNPTSWDWTFEGGDPANSTSQNPSVTYNEAGQYKVKLLVSNEDGSDAVEKDNFITVELPAPVAGFTADRTSISSGETVNFTDQSTNNPNEWSWYFDGGEPDYSELQNPSVVYQSSGTYTVELYVYNDAGSDYLEKENYITVTGPAATDLTFYNTTHTDIYIEVDGDDKTITSGGSVTYYNLTGSSVDYYAETSGENPSGSPTGVELFWDNTIDLIPGSMDRTLVVTSDYFFMYMENDGTRNLTPIEVGTQDVLSGYTPQYTEYDWVVPNDFDIHGIGYFESYTITEFTWIQVRAYYEDSPANYSYWNITSLADSNNQYLYLTNSFRKNSADAENFLPGTGRKVPSEKAIPLYPDYAGKREEP